MMANRGPGPASVPKILLRFSALSVHVGSRKPGERLRPRKRRRNKRNAHTDGDAFPTVPGVAGTRSRTPGQKYSYRTIAVLPSGKTGKCAS